MGSGLNLEPFLGYRVKTRTMLPFVLMLQADADDQLITESTLAETGAPVPVHYLDSPADIWPLLDRAGRPALILLNDRSPMHNGRELVKQLKSSPFLSDIPLVILGEISTPDYIREFYRAGANTYITKPSSVAGTKKKIETFFQYWFDVAEL